MKKLYAFSKFIFYSVGGAEKSMVEILKKKKKTEYDITIIGVDHLKDFNSSHYETPNSLGWKKLQIALRFQFKRFFYLEYFLNKSAIRFFFKGLENEAELITYGFYAPAAILGFSGESTVYLRSETDIGINENYYTGFKRFFKTIHILLEYPFYLSYRNELKASYAKSKLIFNSQWMAKECKKRFSVEGTVEYPTIDFELLKQNFMKHPIIKEKGIVFIGDSEIKGISTVIKIAKILNEYLFFIFTRHITSKVVDKNIVYLPWSTDSSVPFSYAKIVIMPSIWSEAYGRVSIEAQFLDIPVLVSNRGGLPETVNFNEKHIVNEYLDAKVWANKILEVL